MKTRIAIVATLVLVVIFFSYKSSVPVAERSQSVEHSQNNSGASGMVASSQLPQRRANSQDECVLFWNELRSVIGTVKNNTRLPKAGRCNHANDKQLAILEQMYVGVCTPSPKTRTERAVRLRTALCRLTMKDYRAHLTELFMRTTPLNEIKDSSILIDRLMANYGKSFLQTIAISERLLEIDPRMASAAEAIVGATLAETYSERSPNEVNLEKVDVALEKLKNMGSEPALRVAELELLIETVRVREQPVLSQKIETFNTSFPESGLGPYYQAWLYSQTSNKERVVASLTEAINREPSNARFQESLRKVKNARTDGEYRNAFSLGFPINFDNQL